MSDNNITATDARTAPVATWQVVGAMSPEERAAWRMADIPGNVGAAERGADQIPFGVGWYAACYSDEIAVGEVKPLRAFGKELAMWRGEDGQVRVIDAYCKHLGAHMAHGGKVAGNRLECPFHAWRYDEQGSVQEIPYARVIPPQAKRPCGGWPTEEGSGFIWIWYHPNGEAPQWERVDFAEVGDPEWTEFDRYDWVVHAPLQFLAENSADLAHFTYVHGTATFPEAEIKFDGIRRTGVVEAKLGTPKGEVEGKITNANIGPGQAWTRFTGISETLLIAGMTPVDHDKVRVRFAFTQPKAQAEGPMGGLAKALIRDILKQFDQDKVIWDRQKFVEKALICDGDGPIGDFRRWYYQFYAEWGGQGGPTQAIAAE